MLYTLCIIYNIYTPAIAWMAPRPAFASFENRMYIKMYIYTHNQQRLRPNLVPCFYFVLLASTTVCCTGRPATRYRVARESHLRVPTAFQGSRCVRRELKPRKYTLKARYQVGTNPLL